MVGKGGVGKTTAAGALAVASAEGGASTLLLSTDPAHSVGDLFEQRLEPGRATPSSCSERLLLEELDAPATLAEWLARARDPLLELVDRGTYLDAEDVAAFLDLSLPGADEVAAVLRLSEIASRTEPRRIVVDTAPTGHALRLLDASSILRGWAGAFQAMEDKAVAVISGLTRSPVRLAAAAIIEELEARVARFHEDVLAAGEAVLVERPGDMVRAESVRLADALAARGLRVSARALTLPPGEEVEGSAEAPDRGNEAVVVFPVPWREDLIGCPGLRHWGEPADPVSRDSEAAAASPAAPLLASIEVDLLLFVGKGGVGKTTCAAATALGLADRRETTLLGTDPAGSLGDALQRTIPPEGMEIGGAWVRELEAESDFTRFRERYRDDVEEAFRRLGLGDGMALDRRVVASLLELAPPGADEIFAMMALLGERERDSLLVVDAAPTGHLLRLLEMPTLALDWTRQLMRFLVKYRATLGLDAFAERLLEFAKQLKDLDLKLRDPARTAAVIVTLPGPLVAAETERLARRLDAAGVRVEALLLNRGPGRGEGGTEIARDAPRITAPLVRPAPLGPDALVDFFQRWTLAP